MDPFIRAAASALIVGVVVTLIAHHLGAGLWSMPVGVLAASAAARIVGGGAR